MASEATMCSAPVPIFSGDREALTIEQREDSLYKALQWVRDELVSAMFENMALYVESFLVFYTQLLIYVVNK